MADNVRAGSNLSTLPLISTEEVTTLNGGAVTAQQVQRNIPTVRTADGTAVDVTAAAPLPVVQTGTPALPTGAATQATLAAISGQLPATLGQKAAAASASVVLASDQGSVPVSQPGLSGGILQTITTIGATAAALPATPLAGRATMLVQNVGATTIYLGTSTVTADTAATGGLQLLPGQSVPISLAAAVILYAISSAAGGLVMTFEVSA